MPFTRNASSSSLRGEQTWGRAVRHASHDSNRVWGVCVFRPNIARAPRHAIPFRSRAPEHLVNKYLIINQKRVIPKAARTLQRGEGSARKVRSCLQLKLPSCPPRVTPCPPWLKGFSGYHCSEIPMRLVSQLVKNAVVRPQPLFDNATLTSYN